MTMTTTMIPNAEHIRRAIFAVRQICSDPQWLEWANAWHPAQAEEAAICARISTQRAAHVKNPDGQWRVRVEMELASAVAGVAETHAAAIHRYYYMVHPSYPAKEQQYFRAMEGIAGRCESIIARATELLGSDDPPLYHGEIYRGKVGPVGCRCPICARPQPAKSSPPAPLYQSGVPS